MKKILILFFLLIITGVAVWAALWVKQPAQPSAISIGVVAELTGSMPAIGNASKQGAELLVKQVNAAGGVLLHGKRVPVKLIIKDNKSNVETTKAVTQELIDQGVVAIVGPNASAYAIAAADVAEKNKVLLISPWSTNPATTLTATNQPKKYVFRGAYVDSFQGSALAQFAVDKLQADRAAVVFDNSLALSKVQADFFTTQFTKLGGVVVANSGYAGDTSGLTSQLTEIKSKNPQVIFLPVYTQAAVAIIKQARGLGITTPFLGSDAWNSLEMVKACGSLCNGYYISAHYATDSTDPLTMEFVKTYQKTYGSLPTDVAALSYDSVGLVLQAIRNAQDISRQAIVSAMEQETNFHGVTGMMEFIPPSHDPHKSAVILQIKNGSLVLISTIAPK